MKRTKHFQFQVPAILALSSLAVISCGKGSESVTQDSTNPSPTSPTLTPSNTASVDEAVVHGRAIYTVESTQSSALAKFMEKLWMPSAFAASSGSTTVTYTNAGSTNFAINVQAFVPGTLTGSTLSLGSVSLTSLSDNNLKVCGSNGTTKCSQAVIRVYTTGSIAGFVNTADSYGAPVYAGALNPSAAVGLNSAGSVQVQTLAIGSTKHTVSLSDFSSPTYNVSADFSNAGAGSYSMTFVMEYALLQ